MEEDEGTSKTPQWKLNLETIQRRRMEKRVARDERVGQFESRATAAMRRKTTKDREKEKIQKYMEERGLVALSITDLEAKERLIKEGAATIEALRTELREAHGYVATQEASTNKAARSRGYWRSKFEEKCAEESFGKSTSSTQTHAKTLSFCTFTTFTSSQDSSAKIGRPSKKSAAQQIHLSEARMKAVQSNFKDACTYEKNEKRKSRRICEALVPVLEGALGDLSAIPRMVEALAEEGFVEIIGLFDRLDGGAAKHKILLDHTEKISALWRERAPAIRSKLNLSDRKWNEFIHIMCDEWDESTISDETEGGGFVKVEIDGAPLPRPLSLHPLKAVEDALVTGLNYQQTGDGKGGSIGLIESLKSHMKLHDIHASKIAIQVSGDGACMGCITQTALTYKVLGVKTMSDKANTPDLITTLCFYDGDDKYAEAAKHIKRLSKELRSVMNEGFSIDDRTIQVVVLYGGDAKWISGVNGQSGQAHTCPCPWCETERKDFWRGNDHSHVFRTFGKCKEHSHTKDLPFHCSICKETFRSDKDLKDNKKGWKDLREFSLKHKSQKNPLGTLAPM